MVNINGYYIVTDNLVGGWVSTPLKNDGLQVSWDDEIPNWMENKKMFQTTNQLMIYWGI